MISVINVRVLRFGILPEIITKEMMSEVGDRRKVGVLNSQRGAAKIFQA